MKCSEIVKLLQKVIPESLALSGDHVGLWLGRPDRSISKILVALEINERVADYAIENEAQMIITHHPYLYHPLHSITADTERGRTIMKLIRADICCYNAHTNYDMIPGGMADQFARRLGLLPEEPLDDIRDYHMADDQIRKIGIGRLCSVEGGISLTQLCAKIKANFGMKTLEIYPGDRTTDNPVFYRVAVSPGSGKDLVEPALRLKADVLITADVGYHIALDAAEHGMTLINAGHYGMEHIFADDLEAMLGHMMRSEVEVIKMPVEYPYIVL
ncbi:MAG: Nif3-like dinuclear metal center hexameric protein [Lachnospiraceae bacterium]|nr:Nif3-like dinuclear metal center hexameric protein [Lachnospiraceae bacterium]